MAFLMEAAVVRKDLGHATTLKSERAMVCQQVQLKRSATPERKQNLKPTVKKACHFAVSQNYKITEHACWQSSLRHVLEEGGAGNSSDCLCRQA